MATGFAVLRYRLYDIDRLIVGSVVLAVLAALALAGYVLAVGFIGVASARYESGQRLVGVDLRPGRAGLPARYDDPFAGWPIGWCTGRRR